MIRSKTQAALAVAAGLLVAINAWVGARLEALIPESSIDNLLELERRVEQAPNKDHVKVLVFGNSHAVAGLRPAVLASAFGVKPDEAFSLALPGASSREMRLLADRYAARFPEAKVAVCGVEEYFLSANVDMRLRYLTRFNPQERWRYASTAATLDERVGLMATMALPVADFGIALRDAFTYQPTRTLQRLVTTVKVPGSLQDRLSGMAYQGGFPPPWDDAEVQRLMDASWLAPVKWDPPTRAWHLVSGMDQLGKGLNQLEQLARGLERRGMRVVLAEMPYEQPLAAALQNLPFYVDQYRPGLKAYLAASGRKLIPAPCGFTPQCYYDLDHLNPVGARRMAGWIKRNLDGSKELGQGGRL